MRERMGIGEKSNVDKAFFKKILYPKALAVRHVLRARKCLRSNIMRNEVPDEALERFSLRKGGTNAATGKLGLTKPTRNLSAKHSPPLDFPRSQGSSRLHGADP